MADYTIVIPAYNEAGRIEQTIRGIRGITDAMIIVINDGSSDTTAEEAKAAGAMVLSLPFNLGYGAALQTGFIYTLRQGCRFAVQMDADGQHDPSYIGALLHEVQFNGMDVAIGSRFLGEGDYRPGTIKKIGMIFFRSIASLLTGQKITDPTSGFQALSRRALEFYAGDAYPVDFPDADVLIMLHRMGLKFREVPVKMHPSTKEKTMHSGFIPVYYLFKMILSIVVTLLRNHKPGRQS